MLGRRLAARIGSISLATALAGCAADARDPEATVEEAVGSAGQPIKGGYKDDFDTAVVGIVRVSQIGIASCSGTLITPNVVLTAQHCVAPTTGDGSVICNQTKFANPYQASELWITTKLKFSYNANDYHRTKEVLIPPGDASFCGRDIALMILEDSVDAAEAVPRVPMIDVELQKGQEYYAVGYGQLGDNGPSGTRYRRDGLFTKCVADSCPNSYIKLTEFGGDTGVCQGDSGGPAFDLFDRVGGVASRGSSGCENPVYTYVYGWADWIKEQVLYAASLAGTEPPPWATGWPTDPAYSYPVGGFCEAPELCPSNVCIADYCTRMCKAEAPCPDGYECGVDGFCVKLPEPEPPPEEKQKKQGKTTIESGCSMGQSKDPTKPIPWVILPVALFFARRRGE